MAAGHMSCQLKKLKEKEVDLHIFNVACVHVGI